MLSRSHFESASRALAAKYDADPPFSPALQGWEWVNRYPYGYLLRTKRYLLKSRQLADCSEDSELEEDFACEDTATAQTSVEKEEIVSQQYVVYSASFQVPAFYFTVHKSNGGPLTLDELMETTLFRFDVPEASEANGFALTLPNAPFPLLSQGDHPTLGTPCWYLHPCETSKAVTELLNEVKGAEDWDDETMLVRWMETWFMTVGGVLNL